MLTLGEAVRALGAIRDEAAIPSLMKALRYTVTRAEAADALTRFGSCRDCAVAGRAGTRVG